MWAVMSARHAERGMGDGEREDNSELQTEDVHQSAVFLLCTAAPTHCKESRGGRGCPLKTGRGRDGEEWGMRRRRGEQAMLALSLGPPRGNDQTLSLTSAADGHQGPSTLARLTLLLQHFSSFSTFSSLLPVFLPRRLLP